jgi:hypothetical protein
MRAKTSLNWIGLALVLSAGCGSSTVSRSEARDRATSETCNRFDACGQVAAGKAYPDQESCEVDQRAMWQTRWPAEACEGKIDQAKLEVCLTAIHSTECTSALDIYNTIVNKCGQANVCSGGGNPDGG